MSKLTHLECASCNQTFSPHSLQTFCESCHAPILAKYNLSVISETIDREEVANRPAGMWRWYELLPVYNPDYISTLGEGDTPLLDFPNLEYPAINRNARIKDESNNPTASFKARGLSAAVSKALELGLQKLTIPSAGNAGSALAAYASRARIKSATVMPVDTPQAIINECRYYGAEVTLVDGLISDCAKMVDDMTASGEWFSVSTFREPYRLEGKKTLGYELAQQFDWKLPDCIIYPTGGGTGLVGMWKAFKELQEIGWLEGHHLPRMIAVQSEGCAPVVQAFDSGLDHCEFWEKAHTIAHGIRVPISLADRLILSILRQSGGCATTVTDAEILAAQRHLAMTMGIFSSPEGAATFAAFKQLLAAGTIHPEERVVLFITASGVKYS
jgi:threonine synthase